MGININSKILLSVASIAAAAALVIGATFAFFSDTETSSGNTFAAGTLDLKVNGEDEPDTLVTFSAKPSESLEPETITLTNTGSDGGVADLHFTNVIDSDGTETEPECVSESGAWDGDSCENATNPVDNVSTQIGVDICYDLDGNGSVGNDECLIWDDLQGSVPGVIEQGELSWGDNPDPNNIVATLAELNSISFDLGELLGTNAIPPGTPRNLILSFHLDADAGNEYQGDVSTFDIQFTLHQANDDTINNIVPSPAPSPGP